MGKVFRSVCLITCCLLMLLTPFPVRAAEGPTDPAEVEAFLDGAINTQLAANHIAGAVVVVVRDGKILFSKGYGYADVERRTPVDPARTLFRPGSISKLFTWTAVMQLVEQGKLDLNADVNTYLDFQLPATFPEPITLAHLMAHTAGFEDKGQGLFYLTPDRLVPLGQMLKENIPARVFPPGQVSAYSNYGASLAGYIVERVSGEPFEQYIENHIFKPLEMTHSTFRQPVPADIAPDMSQGYNYSQGSYLAGDFEIINGIPAGALSASAEDIAHFMIAHLQDGRYGDIRILQEATAQEMHRQHFTNNPLLPGMAHGFIEEPFNGQPEIGHGGATFLFHSRLFLLPEKNVGLYVSYNTTMGKVAGGTLYEAFMDHYYPEAAVSILQPPADKGQSLQRYAGEYYLSRTNYSTPEKFLRLLSPVNVSVNEEGFLVLQLGTRTFQMAETSPGVFRERAGDVQAIFDKDAGGRGRILVSTLPYNVALKTPWYAGSVFAALSIGAFIVFFLVSLLGWIVAFFVGRRFAAPQPLPARAARWVAVGFGLLALIFLIGLGAVFGAIDPHFGVPYVYFEIPSVMGSLMAIPVVMALLGLAMAVFSVMAWIKGYWGWFSRLHYTLLTVLALALLFVLQYWNLLGQTF